MTDTHLRLTVRLVVADVDAAITFYENALGAELVERFEDPAIGKVVHAAVRVGPNVISFAQSHEEFHNHDPGALGGSPVLLHLDVEDAFATGAAMEKHGAEVVFPIADQFYGKREGRLRDPAGHLWIISQPIEDVDDEEIRRRIASFHD